MDERKPVEKIRIVVEVDNQPILLYQFHPTREVISYDEIAHLQAEIVHFILYCLETANE